MLDGHLIEQHREHALLHLARVLGAQNHHLLLGEVDGHGCGRGHAGGVAVGGEGPCVVDGVVRPEVFQLLGFRADEHVAHEEGVVGARADDAHVDPVVLVPAGVPVDHVDPVARVEVVDGALAVDLPDLACRQSMRSWRPFAEEFRGSLFVREKLGAKRLTPGVMGLFTGPHQMSCSEPGSCTMRLSRGERPVLAPE